MKQYNVGIVGFGFIGKVHAYAHDNLKYYYDNLDFQTRIKAVCTSSVQSAKKAAAFLGAGLATANYRDITENPDIDIVHICTPNNLHLDALLSAMKHNKHIYCDKPLTATLAEALKVEKNLDSYKGIAQMTLQNRFIPAVIRARELIDSGSLGQILEYRACFLHSGSADKNAPLKWKLSGRAGGGVIADLGSHLLDVLHYLLGDYQEITAKTKTAYSQRPAPDGSGRMLEVDCEDSAMILATMKNGAAGSINASKIATGIGDELRLEIHGSGGALRFNSIDMNTLEFYDAKTHNPRKGWTKIHSGQSYEKPANCFPGAKLSIGWLRSHVQCLYNFLDCVHHNKKAEPSLAQGVFIQKLMENIRHSARENKSVTI